MVGLNTYISGLDLSALKEYCVNHGRITQYAKGDYFVKEGEESRYIAYIECGYFNYMVHNSSEQKDYTRPFLLKLTLPTWKRLGKPFVLSMKR